MSHDNVGMVRRVLAELDEDLTFVRDESAWNTLRARIERFFEPECRFSWNAWGQSTEYKGLGGLRQGWLDWLEPWTSYRSETERIIDAGDRVVVIQHDRARGPDSEAEVELRGAGVCVVRDGKLTEIGFYASRDEALEAAGLSGEDAAAKP